MHRHAAGHCFIGQFPFLLYHNVDELPPSYRTSFGYATCCGVRFTNSELSEPWRCCAARAIQRGLEVLDDSVPRDGDLDRVSGSEHAMDGLLTRCDCRTGRLS